MQMLSTTTTLSCWYPSWTSNLFDYLAHISVFAFAFSCRSLSWILISWAALSLRFWTVTLSEAYSYSSHDSLISSCSLSFGNQVRCSGHFVSDALPSLFLYILGVQLSYLFSIKFFRRLCSSFSVASCIYYCLALLLKTRLSYFSLLLYCGFC